VVVPGRAGLSFRLDHGAAGRAGEPAEDVAASLLGLLGSLGYEPLLGGLFGDAHTAADVGPRRAGPPGLVDEVPDEVVGQLAELVGDEHGVGQPLQRVAVGVLTLDMVDEVVKSYR
jgi:hypothetical protein